MGSRSSPHGPLFSPVLDVRFQGPSPSLLRDLVLAHLDGLQPRGLQENEDEENETLLRVFFDSPALRDRAQEELHQLFGAQGVHLSATDLPDEDWAARSQASLRAVTVGRLIVAPPWDRPSASSLPHIPVVVIRPSMAFGTAHHASTRLCLMALQQLELRGCSVLDIGTGSGVLAIAAIRLGAARAFGIDVDPDAVACARENVALNEVCERIEIEERDFKQLSTERAHVVLANLTGAALTRSADVLVNQLAPGGYRIASGFTEDEATVVPTLERTLSRVDLQRESGWVCVVLRSLPVPGRQPAP